MAMAVRTVKTGQLPRTIRNSLTKPFKPGSPRLAKLVKSRIPP